MTVNDAKKPAIRFAGFTDSWEQRKLGEIAEFNPKAQLPESFYYVDLESVGGTEMFSCREENRRTAPSRAQRLAQTGDLFYQTVRPYQKNNYLFEKTGDKYVFSTGYAQMRPLYDGYFLLSLVQTDQFVKFVLNRCTGTSYPAINSNDLADMDIVIPKDDAHPNDRKTTEQQKIGAFFRALDELITLHQRKVDKLVNVKKSMLEKMFPKPGCNAPEIRFSGFTAPWEQRKLGDIVNVSSGFMGDALLSGGTCRLTRIETISDGEVDETRVGYSNTEPDESYLLKRGDILYSNINSITHMGKVALYQGNSILYHGINLLRLSPNSDTNSDYLVQMLNTGEKRTWAKSHANQAVNQASINQSLLASQEVSVCSYTEQEVIGAFFRSLDDLITLHQRKLEKLRNIKKSCLEKMFV